MPLKPGSSDAVIQANIEELIHKGYPPDQAAAIAHENARKDTTSHDGYCWLARIKPDPRIQAIRDTLMGMVSEEGANFLPPDEWHITLVYANGVLPESYVSPLLETAFAVMIDGVGVFDTPDGYAVHLTVRKDPALLDIQQRLYQSFSGSGMEISEHSLPENYTPHITIAYLPNSIEPLAIHPFALEIEHIELDAPDETPLKVAALKAIHSIEQAETFWIGGSLKALGQGLIGGILVPFGFPKDPAGEYFTSDTNFRLEWADIQKLPVIFHHSLIDENGRVAEVRTAKDLERLPDPVDIGRVVKIEYREDGLYCEAQLDLNEPMGVYAYRKAQDGGIAWSSGSVEHLVRKEGDGWLRHWPIVEATVTEAPAGGRRTTIHQIKIDISAVPSTDTDTSIGTPDTSREVETVSMATRADMTITTKSYTDRRPLKMDMSMMIPAFEKAGLSSEQIVAVLKEMGMSEPPPAEEATMAEDTMPPEDQKPDEYKTTGDGKTEMVTIDAKAIAQQVMQAMKAQIEATPAPSRTTPYTAGQVPGTKSTQIEVYTKYKDLSAQEMDFLRFARQQAARLTGQPARLDDAFYRELATKAQSAYTAGNLALEEPQAKRLMAIKANELNSTAVAADGGDWVPPLWSTDLWLRSRLENPVASSIQNINMPSDSYTLPIESTDPVVYAVAEAQNDDDLQLTDQTTNYLFTRSKIVAANVVMNAAKLGVQVPFSMEVTEDPQIQFIPQARNQAMRAMQDGIDYSILNADSTTGTSNINYADGNTSSVPKNKFLYGGGDGIRHLPLVDATTLAVSMGGSAPTLAQIRTARFKMLGAYAANPRDLVYFCDVQTYGKLLSIDELLVFMNNGRGSTVIDGVVPMIDGSPVFISNELSLTNSSGFVSATSTNNTLGQLLIVHKPSWKLGYRRQITANVDYRSEWDMYIMTMTVRIAVARRDTRCAALLYNIAV